MLAMLSFHAWVTIAVVVAATALMAREKLGPDLVMFSALSILVVIGAIEPQEALSGFSRPEIVTIGVLFVVAAAIQETGALALVSGILFGRTRSPVLGLARLVVPTATLSAFLNNTPIVAMFIPVVRTFAQRIGESPSRFLIPLSYASMLGGTCTLIGTASNLFVSGMLQQRGQEPLGMFEIGKVGLPTAIAGVIYLMTIGRVLLVPRIDPVKATMDEAKEYTAEVAVAGDSPLIGRSVQDAGLRHLPGLFLVEIRRADGRVIQPVARNDRLRAGDHLVFTGIASTIQDLTALPGLEPVEPGWRPDHNLFEVVISPSSPLVGRGVRAVGFRRRFDAAILAVHRAGHRIEGKIGDVVIQAGDTLMLLASPGFYNAWRNSPHFYLVSEVPTDRAPRYQKANIALLTLAMMVALPPTTGIPMLVSSMAALVILLATQCITPRAARQAVSWPALMLIASAFGVAQALRTTGAADVLGLALVDLTRVLGPRALLAVLYAVTVTLACFVSNVASAALVFPVAMTAADAAGVDPRPFAIALAMAASAAFATPIGYQANLLVYGPGGYRYLDFTRVGLPLNLICLAIAITLIPVFWPLEPALP